MRPFERASVAGNVTYGPFFSASWWTRTTSQSLGSSSTSAGRSRGAAPGSTMLGVASSWPSVDEPFPGPCVSQVPWISPEPEPVSTERTDLSSVIASHRQSAVPAGGAPRAAQVEPRQYRTNTARIVDKEAG